MNGEQNINADDLDKENVGHRVNQESTPPIQQPQESKLGKLTEEEEYKYVKKPFPIKFVIIGALFSLTLIGLSIYALVLPQVRQKPKDFNPTPVEPEANVPFNADPTHNWRIYQSKTLSLQFKYPNSWSFQESLLQLSNADNSLKVTMVSANPDTINLEYCGTHLNEKQRCRYLMTKNATALLDFGIQPSKRATALITPSKGQALKVVMETNSATKNITNEERLTFVSFITSFTFTQ